MIVNPQAEDTEYRVIIPITHDNVELGRACEWMDESGCILFSFSVFFLHVLASTPHVLVLVLSPPRAFGCPTRKSAKPSFEMFKF